MSENERTGTDLTDLVRELRDLDNLIRNARVVPMRREYVYVDQNELLTLLDNVQRHLPGALNQAVGVVRQRQQVIQKAESEAKKIIEHAEQEAKSKVEKAEAAAESLSGKAKKEAEEAAVRTVNATNAATSAKAAAEREAKSIREQAQKDADEARDLAERAYHETIARANAEAAVIRRNAIREAEQLKSKESVYGMAAVAARELEERTREENAQRVREQNMYLDGALAETDMFLVSLIEEIRQRRIRLQNQG